MDIATVRSLRDKLAESFLLQLREFEMRTGAVVNDVNLVRDDRLDGSSLVAAVRLELKL